MRTLTLAAAGLLLAACGGDSAGPDDEIPAAMVGAWMAGPTCAPGCSFVLTSTTNAAQKIDITAPPASATVQLALTADGAAVLSIFGQTVLGTAAVRPGNVLLLSTGGEVDTVDYVLSGNTLDLKFRSPLPPAIDFTGDQIADPAYGHAILKKQ